MTALAERLNLPQENLITPDTVRRVCWEPPGRPTSQAVAERLADRGARRWQIELVSDVIATALTAVAPEG